MALGETRVQQRTTSKAITPIVIRDTLCSQTDLDVWVQAHQSSLAVATVDSQSQLHFFIEQHTHLHTLLLHDKQNTDKEKDTESEKGMHRYKKKKSLQKAHHLRDN